jgi:hypothetical protein
MKAAPPANKFDLTSTQRGAIGESVVATGLMLASGGQLSPYKPLADDDGLDLLLVDKHSRSIVQLQVKCRTKVDDVQAQTVQFDVRLATFAEGDKRHVLCVLLDKSTLRKAWLIPVARLRSIAKQSPGKLVIVASAKEESHDRFHDYRHDSFESLAQAILGSDTDTPGGTV